MDDVTTITPSYTFFEVGDGNQDQGGNSTTTIAAKLMPSE